MFLTSQGELKVGDFGFARVVDGLCHTRCGSTGYMAPEIARKDDIGLDPKLADVWSIGVILYTISTKCMPFADRDYKLINKKRLVAIAYVPPTIVTSRLRNLIKQFLLFEPLGRIKLEDVSKHAWITDNGSKRGSDRQQ